MSLGAELWRIGAPDRTAGEHKHGYEPAANTSFHIEQYRVFWGAYNFTRDFPEGVKFQVGKSDVRKDWVSLLHVQLIVRRNSRDLARITPNSRKSEVIY